MPDDTAIKLDPKLIMASSLIYMSSVDGTIAQQEWGQLKTVVGGDDKLLENALDYVRETSVDEFLDIASSTLNKEQKICILFNRILSLSLIFSSTVNLLFFPNFSAFFFFHSTLI